MGNLEKYPDCEEMYDFNQNNPCLELMEKCSHTTKSWTGFLTLKMEMGAMMFLLTMRGHLCRENGRMVHDAGLLEPILIGVLLARMMGVAELSVTIMATGVVVILCCLRLVGRWAMVMTVIFIKKRPSLMLSRRMVMEQILVMSVVLPRDIMAEMVDTWVTPATMGLAEEALAMWLVFNCKNTVLLDTPEQSHCVVYL